MGIQLQEISCVRVVCHAIWCVPCGKQGAWKEGRWGELGGKVLKFKLLLLQMYNRKQQKLQWTIGPVTPYGWIDHRYMNDMNWVMV